MRRLRRTMRRLKRWARTCALGLAMPVMGCVESPAFGGFDECFRWNREEMPLSLDLGLADAWHAHAEQGALWWNRESGLTLFGDGTRIIPVIAAPLAGFGGITKLRWDGCVGTSGAIILDIEPDGSKEPRFTTALHELGHILGFNHGEGVMIARRKDREKQGCTDESCSLTESQRQWLVDRYAP